MASTRPRTRRIAVASSGLGHIARGVESWAADLGQALVDRGESVILCKGGGQAEADHERVIPCGPREQARTVRLARTLPRWLAWRVGFESPYAVEQSTFAWNLVKVLQRERINILHVQDPLIALWIERARRMGLVSTRTILAHGTEESLAFQAKIPFLQHLAPWHLEQANAAGIGRESWTSIPNFVDSTLFYPGRADHLRAELGIAGPSLVVLAVAAIKRDHKRIDYLLDEFAHLVERQPDRDVTLVVAGGREPQTAELIATGTARLGDRVRFLPRYARARMPELYRLADLFTLTSLKEMMPIALLEAMASGLPCLIHDHPVMTWMIGPGGRTVAMDVPGALATALETALDDHPWRSEAGKLAHRRGGDVFGRDRVVDQILAYYSTVLKTPPARLGQ